MNSGLRRDRDAIALLELAMNLKEALAIPGDLRQLTDKDEQLRTRVALLRPTEFQDLKDFLQNDVVQPTAEDVNRFIDRLA